MDADVRVENRPDEQRYELLVDGEPAGELAYRRRGDVVELYHTEVDTSRRLRGLGGELVRTALDEIRAAGEHVVPTCPFVAAYIRRHPEYRELVTA